VTTNQLSRTLGLGFAIAVGTLGCAANGGVIPIDTTNSTGATGGITSSVSNTGGTTNNAQVGGSGVVTGGTSAIAQTGGTSSAAGAGGASPTGGSVSTGGSKSTGGSVSTGGKSSSGGASSTGGKSGTSTGGKAPTGGSAATGGSNATGGVSATGGSSAQNTNCSITVKNASYSTAIGSVGIVTWSTTLASVSEAQIDFGVDTNYGMTAPVDLTATDYRTVLLGMKNNHAPYHYRITAKSGSTTCTGTDQVFSANTATAPNNVNKRPTITTNNKSALYGGFLVLEGYRLNSNGGDYAFILDADGDIVWWYQPSGYGTLSAAKMTYDGKSIWIANDNVPQATTHVGKLTMDGLTFTDYSSQFQNFNHDLAVLPDERVAFIAYGTNGCDDVKLRKTDGTVTTLINSGKPFGNATACHCNAIQYDPNDQTVIVSEDDHSGYFKVDLQGTVKWVLNGGTYNSFDKSGSGGTGWTGNHNLHVIGKDHLIIFNNGVSPGAGGVPMGGTAVVRELTLNITNMTTTENWNYNPSPTISNPVMGDVQRLENGNTVIVYSTAGTIHEVNSSKSLLQSIVWSGLSSAGTGYFHKRKTLYGAPPR
jgi:hypothetical protein